EMILYLKTRSENYENASITLNGLLRLQKPAGIRGTFYVRLASGGTVRIKYGFRRKVIFLKNMDTKQEYDQNELFTSLKITRNELMNRAYAFIDGEARSFNDIIFDLGTRAEGPIIRTLAQIDGVLSVMFSGEKVIALRDPKKEIPSLTPLQRSMFRN